MGKVMSMGVRHVQQRFNIENRAHKVISQAKPIKAPMFEANQKDLERIMREHPEIVEATSKKFGELDDRLKSVFVTSSRYVEQRRILNPERPLPKDTTFQGYFEYGYKETDLKKIPLGKSSLRQSIEFISKHQQNPKEYTAAMIAEEYKLDVETVRNVIQNFKMFQVHIPEDDRDTTKKKYLIVDPFDKKSADYNKLLEESTVKRKNPEEKKAEQQNK